MRAPVLTGFGQVNPSRRGLAYLQASASPEAFGAGIAKGLGAIGEGLVDAGMEYQKRNDKTERFGALVGLSEFQSQTAEALVELKRSAPPNVTDFPKQVNDLYVEREREYLTRLPPRLQPEFQFRARQIKQGIMADALQFQYTQQDAFFVEGINKEYERAKNAVYATPAEYAKWNAHVAETIAASDLPAAEKARLAREMDAGLTAVLYGREQENAIRGGRVTPHGSTPANVEGAYAGLVKRGLPTMQAAVAAGNIQQESGGRPNAWNRDEGALGIIQWRLDRLTKLRTFAARAGRSPEDIDVQLDFLIQEGRQLGSDQDKAAWAEFMAATTEEQANAALKKFIRYGDNSAGTRLANAKRLMGVDPSTIEVGPTATEEIDADPRFSSVTLEDRLAIQKDAQTKVDQEVADAVKAATDAANAARNALYVGLHDGTMGTAEIQAARNAGLLTDVDDIEKAEKIVADREKGLADQQFMNAVIASGAGYGTQDNERFNNWFKTNAPAVAAMDTGNFNTSILPAVQSVQDIPTDLVGQLTAMSRSNNTDQMRWAYERFLDLEDKAPEAFRARVTDDLSKQIDHYRYMREAVPDEELNAFMKGGRNPQEIATRGRLEAEARAILANPNSTSGKLAADVTEIAEMWWGPITGTPILEYGAVRIELQNEFTQGFISNFRVTGNEEDALALTKKQLLERWGPSSIGGRGKALVKLPIDKAGYPPISYTVEGPFGTSQTFSDYEGWEDVIRREYKLVDDETFVLVADRQTEDELRAYRTGQTSELPSYVVTKFTADGVPIPMDDRWFGAP